MENYEYTRPPVDRRSRAQIKKLKKTNTVKSIWIGILIFIILLLIVSMGLGFARYYKKNYKDPSYEYISMTEEASARAYVWLSKIEDTDLSYEDVKLCMGTFNLEVIKKPAEVKGEYAYELADGSYEYCVSQAKVGFEKAYYMAVQRRIANSNYEGDITDELVDKLMNDTFGISVSEYIARQDIKLIPDLYEIDVKRIIEKKDSEEKEVTNEEK